MAGRIRQNRSPIEDLEISSIGTAWWEVKEGNRDGT